jgi:hypothetical protein
MAKDYLEHMLKTGSPEDRQEAIGLIKSKFVLNNRKISLKKYCVGISVYPHFIKSKDDNLVADDTDDMFDEREREPINKYHFLSFSQLYDICENYRKKHNIDKNDHVFLLSGANNYQNWFSNMDHEGNNYFVQVTEWELFFGAEISCGTRIFKHQINKNTISRNG